MNGNFRAWRWPLSLFSSRSATGTSGSESIGTSGTTDADVEQTIPESINSQTGEPTLEHQYVEGESYLLHRNKDGERYLYIYAPSIGCHDIFFSSDYQRICTAVPDLVVGENPQDLRVCSAIKTFLATKEGRTLRGTGSGMGRGM